MMKTADDKAGASKEEQKTQLDAPSDAPNTVEGKIDDAAEKLEENKDQVKPGESGQPRSLEREAMERTAAQAAAAQSLEDRVATLEAWRIAMEAKIRHWF
jgi:hypothetical protein